MRVLVACEESQEVCKAFREKGHDAFSCDILEPSGGHPEWHIQGDVLEVLDDSWDMIIAFPPCTYLTITGNRWFNISKYGDMAIDRQKARNKAIVFFMNLVNAPIPKKVIENPIGVMSTQYRRPDQIVEPFMFGDPYQKKTCLWLEGLSELQPTNIVEPEKRLFWEDKKTGKIKSQPRWYALAKHKDRARLRSKTFPGIAKAMAEQWGSGEDSPKFGDVGEDTPLTPREGGKLTPAGTPVLQKPVLQMPVLQKPVLHGEGINEQ